MKCIVFIRGGLRGFADFYYIKVSDVDAVVYGGIQRNSYNCKTKKAPPNGGAFEFS